MPTLLLTAKMIESVKPTPGRQTEYWDTSVRGFLLRVSPHGRSTYGVFYRHPITRRTGRVTIGTTEKWTLAEAREKARKLLGDVAHAEDPATAKRDAQEAAQDTFGKLAAKYLSEYAQQKKRTWKEDDRVIRKELLPAWEHAPVSAIRRRDVSELIEGKAKTAPIMANRMLALISRILNHGIRAEWLESNVAALIEAPGVEHSRDRLLTGDELRALWLALHDPATEDRPAEAPARLDATMSDCFLLLLLTGQRLGEVAGMRWSEVDLETAWWTIPGERTKNKQEHRVPLTAPVLSIITARRNTAKPTDVFVFSRAAGASVAARAKKAAASLSRGLWIEDEDGTRHPFAFRAHDLRRTVATKLAEAGIPPGDISRVLNHVDGGPRATRVYNRYAYDVEKRAALETWARSLEAITTGKPAKVIPIRRGRAQ
jgi:integrase